MGVQVVRVQGCPHRRRRQFADSRCWDEHHGRRWTVPIRKVKGGYKWGSKGKVYKSRKGAARQARAAYAHGYKSKGK